MDFVKIGVWILVGTIVLGSLFFQDNLFMELSWTSRYLLIGVVIYVLLVGSKKEYVPSPMEMQFYDNYLIIYRPKRYYSKRITRMEIEKMMYADIKACVYKAQSHRIHIYGRLDATRYNYDSNGKVGITPVFDKVVDDTFLYFSTRCAEDVDFKQVIEEHSPIQMMIENS